ncbi:MAG: hypothetical protein ABFD65_13870 [Candidatus Polarisedimenticolia bacterium]
MREVIDVRKLAAEAASQFGLSLKDDPTAWDDGEGPLGDTPPPDIVAACRAEAARNALSAVNRALGAASEAIATEMDVAIHEDGPLADLAEVWARRVTGLTVDLDGVAGAKDWQGRVDALREAIRRAVPAVPALAPAPALKDVLAYLNSDPRFDGLGKLKKGVAALNEDGTPFTPPAFLTKGRPVEPEPVEWDDEPAPVEWDDEPAPAPAAPAQRKRGRGSKAAAPSLVPGFPAMLNGAGMTKADVARLCGYSESYVGYIFSGKKPWPGLKAEQATALREEVAARLDALTEALAVLDSGKLLLPAEA